MGGRILPQFAGIGQTGGFLGPAHAPYVVPQRPKFINHYGVTRFSVAGPELTLRDDVPLLRLSGRRRLFDQLDDQLAAG